MLVRLWLLLLLHLLVWLPTAESLIGWTTPRLAAWARRTTALGTARRTVDVSETDPPTIESNNPSVDSLWHVEGYVIAKRKFGASLCFLDLWASTTSNDAGILPADATPRVVQVLLKRQDCTNETLAGRIFTEHFEAYVHAMVPGLRIAVTGTRNATTTGTGTPLLRAIQSLTLTGWPRNPQHVRLLLQAASCHSTHASRRLPWTEMARLMHGTDLEALGATATDRSVAAMAREILARVPVPHDYPTALLARRHQRGVHTLAEAAPHGDPPLRTNNASTITRTAWVQNRRRLVGNITVIELKGDTSDATSDARGPWVLHPKLLEPSQGLDASIWGTLLAPGAQVQVQGYQQEHNDNTTASYLWVTQCRLLRASARPLTVRYLVELVHAHQFSVLDAATALSCPPHEIDDILQQHDVTARQWHAAELAVALQRGPCTKPIPTERQHVLHTWANVRRQFPVQAWALEPTASMDTDVSREGSRWKRNKEPQLEWMTRQITKVVHAHACFGQRPLHILDIGGGKGFLANKLAGTLGDAVQVRVMDVAPRAVRNGAMTSQRLQLPVTYTVRDASQLNAVTKGPPVDVVVALHACGALSDVALGHAIVHHATFVICPCCFQSNPHLWVPLPLSHEDGHGHIHRVPVEQWLNVDTHDYQSLKLLAEVQGDAALATQAMHTICALRATAVRQRHAKDIKVSIQSFPVAYSSRNFCLVGTH